MERAPYQKPQTLIERRIMELVEHLRNGTDNRSGFSLAVENTMALAFSLEKSNVWLREENNRLNKMVMPSFRGVSTYSKEVDTRDPEHRYLGGAIEFTWCLEEIKYRGVWKAPEELTPEVCDHIKRKTYREILKIFRADFLKTWTLNMSRIGIR